MKQCIMLFALLLSTTLTFAAHAHAQAAANHRAVVCQEGYTGNLSGAQTPYQCTIPAGTLGPKSGVKISCLLLNSSGTLDPQITVGTWTGAWVVFPQSAAAGTKDVFTFWNDGRLDRQWGYEEIQTTDGLGAVTGHLVVDNFNLDPTRPLAITCGAASAGHWFGEGFTVEIQ